MLMSYRKKEEQTTKRIIASAQHTFAQKGLPNVTLQEIALKIGMSNEVMFTYFEGKEMLIETILKLHIESLKDRLTPKLQTQTLYQLLSTLNEKSIVDGDESLFLPIYSEAFLPYIHSNELKHTYRNFFDELHNFFVADIEERIAIGEIEEEIDTTTIANMLVSMLDGAVLNRGFFTDGNDELILKQRMALLQFQLLHWQFKIKDYMQNTYTKRIKPLYRSSLAFLHVPILTPCCSRLRKL